MGKERFSERQTAVLSAAARLDEVAALPETDIVRDAAIQRFEFTFELVWKTLQLYLEHEGFEAAGPRAVLKRAFGGEDSNSCVGLNYAVTWTSRQRC